MNDPHMRTPAGRLRARGLGIPFDGVPGPLNAITDVTGLEVGATTLISGTGPLVVGRGPVRTGVTAILPRGRAGVATPVFGGGYSLNGNGEMTGFLWVEEAGRVDGPITLTNTHSCGLARDATVRWLVERAGIDMSQIWGLPVAAETYDGRLNDINGFHVREAHVFTALDDARGGPVEEGSVGGGTGMICYGFKGGSGTASRIVETAGRRFTLGAFVQANFGTREELIIAGVPVGRYLPEAETADRPADTGMDGAGSVIGIIATDAPLMPHQLKRLARRCALGIGRSGAVGAHTSGDIFLAISTANAAAAAAAGTVVSADMVPDPDLTPLFTAVVQAIDEAVLNALVANETMTGRDGHTVTALPHEAVREVLRRHNRLDEPPESDCPRCDRDQE
ncbi:MAG: S58 family peptidase [Alphaproteobacteria bacterium]|nr:MAG: S58 family peptidase [Alphaproteobacteria bacterium]